AELSAVLGYAFYRMDERGRAREFSAEQGADYLMKLDDVAHDISNILVAMRRLREAGAETGSEAPRVVYVAEAASDLVQEREQVRREMMARGYEVLPARALPLEAGDYLRAVREDVSRADLSVHLVGGRRGVVPEDEERSIVDLQFDVAAQASKHCL